MLKLIILIDNIDININNIYMTLTQFSYIVAISNYKSFGEAAEHCYVTQPTLSMQVKKLEDELGIRIFDRSKQPVEPTDIGKKIIEQARVILKEKERVVGIIDEEKGELRGKFKVGIIPTIAPYLIHHFLVNFISKYPNVELIFEEIQTEQIISKLITDELDTAIIATPTYRKELIEKPIYYEPFVAYVSEGNALFKRKKISSKYLNVDELWLLKEGHCFRDHVIQLCNSTEQKKNRGNINLSFEGGSLDTLMKLVDNNFGITLLPYLATVDLKNTDRWRFVKEFIPPVPKRIINIVYHRAYLKKRLIDALEVEIIKSIPKSLIKHENGLFVV